jgi:hypothetical protein
MSLDAGGGSDLDADAITIDRRSRLSVAPLEPAVSAR